MPDSLPAILSATAALLAVPVLVTAILQVCLFLIFAPFLLFLPRPGKKGERSNTQGIPL